MLLPPRASTRLVLALACLLALSVSVGATARASFLDRATWSVRETIERFLDGSAKVEGSGGAGGRSWAPERNPHLDEQRKFEAKLFAALDDCNNEVWDSITFGLAPDMGSLGDRTSEDIEGVTNKIKIAEETAKANARTATKMGEHAAASTFKAVAKKLGWLGTTVSAKFIFDACHTRLGAAQEQERARYNDYVKWEVQKDPASAYIDAKSMRDGDWGRGIGEGRQNREAQELLCERISSVPGGRLSEKELAREKAINAYVLGSSGYDVHPDRCHGK